MFIDILGFAVMTTVYALVLLPFIYVALTPSNANVEAFNEIDPGRNERSTPRTFVLPASPIVAFEQERKRSLLAESESTTYCMLKLKDFGYEPGAIGSIFDVNLFVATPPSPS